MTKADQQGAVKQMPGPEQIRNHSAGSPLKSQQATPSGNAMRRIAGAAELRQTLRDPPLPRLTRRDLAPPQSSSNGQHRLTLIATGPPLPRPINSINKPCAIVKNFAPVYSNNSTLSLQLMTRRVASSSTCLMFSSIAGSSPFDRSPARS